MMCSTSVNLAIQQICPKAYDLFKERSKIDPQINRGDHDFLLMMGSYMHFLHKCCDQYPALRPVLVRFDIFDDLDYQKDIIFNGFVCLERELIKS